MGGYDKDYLRRLTAQIAGQYGIRPDLFVSLVDQESGFNPGARSPKNAQGLTQLIPSTAKRFNVSNPWDPEQNLHGGAQYFRWLLDRFGRDERLALAGYNAGEGAVDKHGGVPPYRETQNYVRNIMQASNTPMSTPAVAPQSLPMQPGFTTPPGAYNPVDAAKPIESRSPGERGAVNTRAVQEEPSLLENPWLQMGLGILANPQGADGNMLTGVAKGVQQGLMVSSEAKRKRLDAQEERYKNALYQYQLGLQQWNLMGGGALTPQDRLQATGAPKTYLRSDGSTVVAWYDRLARQFFDTTGQPVTDIVAEAQTTPTTQRPVSPRPVNVMMPGGSIQTIDASRDQVPPGAVLANPVSPQTTAKPYQFNPYDPSQKPRTIMLRPGEDAPADGWVSQLPTAPKVGAGAAKPVDVGGQSMGMIDAAIGQLMAPLAELETNPNKRRQFGTLGQIGADLSAIVGSFDAVTGTDLNRIVTDFYGGDPQDLYSQTLGIIQPIARLMVDAKGPLADKEQARAAQLVGLSPDKLMSPEQSIKLRQETIKLAISYRDKAARMPPEWWKEKEKPLRELGLSPPGGWENLGASTPPVMQAAPPPTAAPVGAPPAIPATPPPVQAAPPQAGQPPPARPGMKWINVDGIWIQAPEGYQGG
jgi:hypothetical protein